MAAHVLSFVRFNIPCQSLVRQNEFHAVLSNFAPSDRVLSLSFLFYYQSKKSDHFVSLLVYCVVVPKYYVYFQNSHTAMAPCLPMVKKHTKMRSL